MYQPSGFDSLPLELCDLIVSYTQSRKAISRLSQTCKRNYSIFIPFLYSELEVDQRVLSTLPLSPEERALSSLPHPASFVKDLHMELDDHDLTTVSDLRKAVGAFKKKAHLFLKIMAEQSGGRPPLKKLSIDTRNIPFPRVVGPLDFGCFRNLVDLSLVCEFPDKTVQDTMSILSSIETQKLTSLHLGILECRQPSRGPKPELLAQLLELIASTCTNLTFLGLAIPLSRTQNANPVNRVFWKMTFPALRSLLVNGHGAAGNTNLNFNNLLAKHPLLESLQYFSSLPISREVVPVLKSFTGSSKECIRMCESKRPIYEVHAHFDPFHSPRNNPDVVILRRFSLTCSTEEKFLHPWLFRGVSAFLRACPQIINLDLDIPGMLWGRNFTSIIKELPRLETIKVYVEHYISEPYDPFVDLSRYGESVVEFLTPSIRQVTVEMTGTQVKLELPQRKETFIFTIHPHENGVGRVVKGLSVNDGAQLELDVKLQQERGTSE